MKYNCFFCSGIFDSPKIFIPYKDIPYHEKCLDDWASGKKWLGVKFD